LKTDFPESISIVGISRVGFNEDFTQSLIWIEFYGMDKKLKRRYLLITWDPVQQNVNETKWFSAE